MRGTAVSIPPSLDMIIQTLSRIDKYRCYFARSLLLSFDLLAILSPLSL
uniref:Uncharacterized protein n=1 Tax=Rhizophora mucronata TaxID=61149 RepID=A0A2P2LNB0_RHIMU